MRLFPKRLHLTIYGSSEIASLIGMGAYRIATMRNKWPVQFVKAKEVKLMARDT